MATGGKLFLTGFLALFVLTGGCLCCSTDGLKGILDGKDAGAGGTVNDNDISRCNPPYIYQGTGCCLDENGNDICDSDESTDTTVEMQYIEVTTTTLGEDISTETTLAPTTTLGQAASTTTLKAAVKSTYGCVQDAGYDPDEVIFVYSTRCGNDLTATAMHAASFTGVGFQMVDISKTYSPPDDKRVKLLECFYGGYYEGNGEFTSCPRLLCPKTGKIETVDGKHVPYEQMKGFANRCK